jgi:hypothetical protein
LNPPAQLRRPSTLPLNPPAQLRRPSTLPLNRRAQLRRPSTLPLNRPVQFRRPSTLPLPCLRIATVLALTPAARAHAEPGACVTNWPLAGSRP